MKERRKGTKGEGRQEGLIFAKKIKKKKNPLSSYMATYRVLTVLPQMRFHVSSAGDILQAAPS